MKNYILIGLGPHAKRIYYPFLEKYQPKYNINLKLIVDLKNQKSKISQFIKERKLKPEKIVLLPNGANNTLGKKLDPLAKRELELTIKKFKIDGIIISTEPKTHKIYAEWAIENNINILMDKPITTPTQTSTNIESAKKIYKDYLELKNKLKKSKSKFYVMCQRRNHRGYTFIKDYLEKFVSEYKIPISYIDIYHADGAWNLPHEFQKENHPYKYGYGKLMHSGYHFVDLLSWISKVNATHSEVKTDSVKMYTARFAPNDFFHQVTQDSYKRFFNNKKIADFYADYKTKNFDHFGELDAYALMQFKKDKRVITTASINLQQNSFSKRGWFQLPEDTYKGNGRVRHERINIQVSHLLNIQVHSYQSFESKKKDEEVIEQGDTGDKDHFDIYIFRNSNIIGGTSFTKISLGKNMKEENKNDSYYLGHNELAREKILLNFIEQKDDDSELQYHEFTNKILSNLYLSMAKDFKTSNSQVVFKV